MVDTYMHAITDHEFSYEQLDGKGVSEGELAGTFPQADAKDYRKTGCTLQTL